MRSVFARGLAALVVVAVATSCGGSSDSAATAACGSTMEDDGTVYISSVAADDGTYAYTLVPLVSALSPMQYTVVRGAVADAGAGCQAVAYSAKKGDALVAADIPGTGRTVTLGFKPVAGTDNVFQKISGTGSGTITGYVGGATPVANATVVVRDASGAVIGTAQTNDSGAFLVGAVQMPDTVKVVATGGTQGGVAVTGSLKAQMENFTAAESAVSLRLTPVTTLVSAYHERYPGVSLDDAMGRVKEHLGIPPDMSIDADDQSSADYVDEAAFFTAAAAAGGLDSLVQAVLTDWDEGTTHQFVPAAPQSDEQPTVLTKMILDAYPAIAAAQRPMNATAGAPTAFLPPNVKTALELAAAAYGIYNGQQQTNIQAQMLESLRRIEAEVNQMSKKIDQLTQLALEGLYATKLGNLGSNAVSDIADHRLDTRLNRGFQSLYWINATTRVAKPDACADLSASKIKIGSDAWYALPESCRSYAFDALTARDHRENVRVVLAKNITNLETQWNLMRDNVTTGDNGLIVLYRAKNTDHIKAENNSDKGRKFYTYTQSRYLWDHYRYWQNQLGLLFFFQAGFIKSLGLSEADFNTRIDNTDTSQGKPIGLFQQVVARFTEAAAAMPERQLPWGMFVDPYNTDFNNTKVGEPMVWWPFKPDVVRSCGETVTYTPQPVGTNPIAENILQAQLRQQLNCMANRNEAGGLNGWRVPTTREWEAFTQTAGKPGAKPVGEWLTERGLEGDIKSGEWFNGDWFNGKRFYSVESATCPAYYGSYSAYGVSCSRFEYFFRFDFAFNDGQAAVYYWKPSFRFGVDHRVEYAGTVAYVMPVRQTKKGEFF